MSTDDLFFTILRSSLWSEAPNVNGLVDPDWKAVFAMAREQTVDGLMADGIASLNKSDSPVGIPPEYVRSLMIQTIGIERANAGLNKALSEIAGLLKENGIEFCLVKGQGVARNYPHPEHRSPGDIDFLLDDGNYRRASTLLTRIADEVLEENVRKKHLGMMFHGKVNVELHGTVRASFGEAVNNVIDSMQDELFRERNFRHWDCLGVDIALPSVKFDSVFIFTHFVQHFYHSGLGLRQVCDWTTHLHRFASEIDSEWIEQRLKALGMMREWKAFGYFAVSRLGLPKEEMPFFDPHFAKYSDMIWASMKHSGNFGRKMNAGRDMNSEPFLLRKIRSLKGHLVWMSRHFSLSPRNTIKAICHTLCYGMAAAAKGI